VELGDEVIVMREESQLTREQLVLRIGAVCVVVGSVLIIVFRILHGDLPADKGGAASLSYVASYPLYPFAHLGDVLGFLVFTGGLVALSDSLTHPGAWAIGRLGMASVLVGAIVHITEFSIDGYALTTLAHKWAVALPVERPNLEFAADAALTILGGPAALSLSIVWGSTLALYGLAVKKQGYSVWLGWTGIVLGTVLFVMGITQYLRPNIFPGVLLYGGGMFVAHLWAIVLAIAMWRRAGSIAVATAPQHEPTAT
jgi:hypothetical protein